MGNKNDFSAEKRTIRDKLMAVILLETSKDYKEMDSDLVRECVDFLAELEGKEKLTKKEIEQRVSEIPFKGKVTAISSHAKKKLRAKRLAVTAAVLAVLLAIFSILAVSYGRVEDGLVGRGIRYIIELMNGGEQLEFDNIELIKDNKSKRYSSVEKLVKDENISIMFPTWLPEDEKITKCWYIDDITSGKHYLFQCKKPQYSMYIYLNTTIPNEIEEDNPLKILRNLDVYIISEDNVIQGVFEHNNHYYSVHANTEENLLKIIENLKEIE